METNDGKGINKRPMKKITYGAFGGYLALALFFILLMFGPIGDYKYSLLVRLLYVFVIPYFISWFTPWLLNKLNVSEKAMIVLYRILLTSIGILFVYITIDTSQQTTHWENTKTIMTRDGYENVGDDVEVRGVNWIHVFISSIIALTFLWAGFLKYIKINSDLE